MPRRTDNKISRLNTSQLLVSLAIATDERQYYFSRIDDELLSITERVQALHRFAVAFERETRLLQALNNNEVA